MRPHTVAMGHRNDALRAARLRAGWRSMEAAAAALQAHGQRFLDDPHYTVSARTWRRWEGGAPGWPPEETATVLHDALGRWPEDLGFTVPADWIRPEAHQPEAHQEEDVRRRTFISVTAAALMPGPVATQQVDPALIDYFQQQLEGHYRADMFLGPHDLIGTVSAQYQLIDKLVRSAKGETRSGLLRVGAAYAALVGWLYQDAGDLGAAAFWRGSHRRSRPAPATRTSSATPSSISRRSAPTSATGMGSLTCAKWLSKTTGSSRRCGSWPCSSRLTAPA